MINLIKSTKMAYKLWMEALHSALLLEFCCSFNITKETIICTSAIVHLIYAVKQYIFTKKRQHIWAKRQFVLVTYQRSKHGRHNINQYFLYFIYHHNKMLVRIECEWKLTRSMQIEMVADVLQCSTRMKVFWWKLLILNQYFMSNNFLWWAVEWVTVGEIG